jgi:hypothetical protein
MPLFSSSRPLFAGLLLLGGTALAGCNALETGYQGESVDELVTDAVIARQSGDLDQSQALLEEAHRQDPSHTAARVELAETLMQQAGLTVQSVEAFASHLTARIGESGVGAAPSSARGGEPKCTFDGRDVTVEAFDPTAFEGTMLFDEAVVVAGVVLGLITNVGDVAADAVPDQIALMSSDQLCETVDESGFDYDRGAALAAFDESLTEPQVVSALTNYVLASSLAAYDRLFLDLTPEYGLTWYRVETNNSPESDPYLGHCAVFESEAAENQFYDRIEEGVIDLGRAAVAFELRAAVLGYPEATAAALDGAAEAYEASEEDLVDYCEG